ncbi:deoxyribodipyrimidine photolyase [Pedobacter yulinensis]|uniref:Deoxyribodipyrimidine photolyase n=1 Tax=Pedobacter yulinensis TaxID=2126353 RepID=A0A2T3HPL0_9SPHI|nr:deoxyribodipyrimidine photo-lyase [Pedobacter yulinensis]PST84366.1 deoxyribodipyrimidine photolyase [Pedobacter yulinensis]
MKETINICWLRRDLRLDDHAALYHALRAGRPVLPLFIFDTNILDELNPDDARVTFIHQEVLRLQQELKKHGSGLLVCHGKPEAVWNELVDKYDIGHVFANRDYEPYARERDDSLAEFLSSEQIGFRLFKDQVIFETSEVVKPDGKPYTVYTPYWKRWRQKLEPFFFAAYPTEKYFRHLYKGEVPVPPSLEELGFGQAKIVFPPRQDYRHKLADYGKTRDFPALEGTSRLGIHLRFGTVSIREAVRTALEEKAEVWISELAWREFYMMILWYFPNSATYNFKTAYDKVQWRNNKAEFEAWCTGQTGYPLVDAGMRQMNATGYMHNRVRMVTASFLTKHLLVDWRWGEAYFAEKLLDYDLASNVGGWQWAFGSGNDAAPYFRVFNPELQAKRFDPDLKYIKKWVPEYGTKKYAPPIVEHTFARERVLKAFKKALG